MNTTPTFTTHDGQEVCDNYIKILAENGPDIFNEELDAKLERVQRNCEAFHKSNVRRGELQCCICQAAGL